MSQPTIKMFNTTGPCVPEDHYMLPVLSRRPEIEKLIKGKFYFVLHAPRQSGKTTFLDFLTDKINSEGQFYAINCTLMTLRNIDDNQLAIQYLYNAINQALFSSTVEIIKNKADIYTST
ncbi:MAG: hypothetical protein LBT38_11085 [Deltaproteobacteria bacterium]|jgi:predicted AAA+ superfamily ATPase|nr:hypothetical protein [Deltaproteobacteria bacterium]